MSERRFALVDFTHMNRAGCLRLYEAGRAYTLPRAVAHAATKREFVAKQRPPHWTPPSIFRQSEVLTEAEVIEAERSKPARADIPAKRIVAQAVSHCSFVFHQTQDGSRHTIT